MKSVLLLVTFFMLIGQSYAAAPSRPIPIGSLAHFCDANAGVMSNNDINSCLLSSGYACSGIDKGYYIKCRPQVVKKMPKKSVMTAEQIRAMRLAEWNKAHSKKSANKVVNMKKVNLSSLPEYCGNFAVFYGKVNYHRLEKAYYIKHHYSNRTNNFSLFKLNQVTKNLLGKTIIFLGNRNATYPPSSRQKGVFQSIFGN